MKIAPILLTVALALSACARPPEQATGPGGPSTDCLLVAEIARAQYGYDATMTLSLNREAFVPQCDWAALNLTVEVLDYDRLQPLSSLFSFERPRRSGWRRIVRVLHYNGIHSYQRVCQLEQEAGQWRLVEECPVTWSF